MIDMAGCAYDDGFHSDEIILGSPPYGAL
jgi:hypothetical protein